jgi:hypothetical protein
VSERGAWIWSQALSQNAVGDPAHSYNSAGQTNRVERVALGRYTVVFPSVSTEASGIAHVSSTGNDANRCAVGSLTHNESDVKVDVYCHAPGGAAAVDAAFTASYLERSKDMGLPPGGYVFYTGSEVSSANNYNSAGQANEVTSPSTGAYTVTLRGISESSLPRLGHAIVTAYGTDGKYCKVESFVPGADDQVVKVRCFTGSGTGSNSAFMLSFDSRFAVSASSGGYARANDASAASYTPDEAYQYTEIDGAAGTQKAAVDRSATGVYAIGFPGLSMLTPSITFAGAYGISGTNTATLCKVSSFAAGVANIRCYAPNGLPADNEFLVTYATYAAAP